VCISDAWFIGLMKVVGVWVDNDDDAPMKNSDRRQLPALIWKDL
jgi:hypothetical protein